ncbi:MAG: LPS export ABC transporter periplasmic protein LptC [Syntrophothermus sp.]
MRRWRFTRRVLAGLGGVLVATALLAFFLQPESVPPDVSSGRPATPAGATALGTDRKAAQSRSGESVEGTQPGLEFGGTKLVGRHKGEKQWELVAERIGLPEAGKLVRVKGIRDSVVYKDGKPFLHLSADEAVYQMETEGFTLKGRIQVRTTDGDRLKADELRWDGAAERLVSQGPVALSLNGAGVTAGRLVVDTRDEKLILQGDVLIARDKERIRSPEAVYMLKDRVLQIIGPADVHLVLEREKERR